MTIFEKVQIGDATLYRGDALEIAHTLGDFDALISDPPYGQGLNVNTMHAGGKREKSVVQRNGKTLMVRPNTHSAIIGDDQPFDPSPWIDFAPIVMLWGAHKFADRLPAGGWLVWDKVPTGKIRDQGDGEAAWINDDRPMRIFRLLWDGLCVGAGARHEVTAGQKRLHPAQKPEMLMRWCIKQAGHPKRIIDPYFGSCATGVAAIQMGCEFVGIELDSYHFETGCRRIEAAQRQESLFPARLEQVQLDAFVPEAL